MSTYHNGTVVLHDFYDARWDMLFAENIQHRQFVLMRAHTPQKGLLLRKSPHEDSPRPLPYKYGYHRQAPVRWFWEVLSDCIRFWKWFRFSSRCLSLWATFIFHDAAVFSNPASLWKVEILSILHPYLKLCTVHCKWPPFCQTIIYEKGSYAKPEWQILDLTDFLGNIYQENMLVCNECIT